MRPTTVVAIFCVCLLVRAADATFAAAMLTEFENSLPAYTRYAPELWNALMRELPSAIIDVTDRLAYFHAFLHQGLSSRLPVCTAVERAFAATLPDRKAGDARAVGTDCRTRWFGGPQNVPRIPAGMLAQMRMAHNLGLATVSRKQADEAASASNARVMSATTSSDAAVTYNGKYANNVTRAVYEALRKPRARR